MPRLHNKLPVPHKTYDPVMRQCRAVKLGIAARRLHLNSHVSTELMDETSSSTTSYEDEGNVPGGTHRTVRDERDIEFELTPSQYSKL